MASNRGNDELEEGWNNLSGDSTATIKSVLDGALQINQDLTSTLTASSFNIPDLNASILDVSSFVHVKAPVMPLEARPISDLIFLNKAEEDAKDKKSAHSMNTVNVLNSDDPNAIHYCKNVILDDEPDNPIVELEDLNAAVASYLCTDYTPRETYAYYDTNYKLVKISSREIFNFKSNQEDPLTENNFILDINNLMIDNKRFYEIEEEFNKSLQDLSQLLQRNKVDENSSYLERCINATVNTVNFFVNPALTAVKCKSSIDQYLVSNNKDSASLKKLLQLLKDRSEHIAKVKIADEYKNEQIALAKAIEKYTPKEIINNEILDIFDELEKIIKEKGINIDELNETERRTEKVFGNEYEFSVSALKNYSILKAMGYRRVLQKLENEGDDHNRNSGKKGGFDDDHKQEDVTYFFTKHSQAEIWFDLRRPKENTFKFTARDYCILPHSIDAKPFYSPTTQIDVNESVVTAASFLYHDLKKNFFTSTDNAVYTKLATIPLFEYFKHQNTLKYILTDVCIYENIHDLHLRKAWKYVQQGDALEAFLDYNNSQDAKTLLSKMNEKKSSKIQEITNALITEPQFRDFLIYHGARALKIIKQEVQSYKDNLIRKLPNKPYYQKLIDSLDIDKFDKIYREIYAKTLESTKQINLQEMNTSQQMNNSQKLNGSQKQEISASQKMVISQTLNNSSRMTDSSNPVGNDIAEEKRLKFAMG